MERKNIKTIYGLLFKSSPAVRMVNIITLYRIITSPLLIFLIFLDQLNIFKWLLLASFSTDAIDGRLARKYKAVSILGSKLDSIGDDLTVLVGIIALLKTNPEFIKEQAFVMIGLLGLFFIQLSLSLFKYKKLSSFHTYLAKMAAVSQGFFLLSVFFFETIFYPLFYTALVITAFELIEEIILTLLLPKWKNDVKGLYWVLKKEKHSSSP